MYCSWANYTSNLIENVQNIFSLTKLSFLKLGHLYFLRQQISPIINGKKGRQNSRNISAVDTRCQADRFVNGTHSSLAPSESMHARKQAPRAVVIVCIGFVERRYRNDERDFPKRTRVSSVDAAWCACVYFRFTISRRLCNEPEGKWFREFETEF